jgi:hypothetical protein
MKFKVLLCGLVLVTLLPRPLEAQAPPRLVRFTGVVRDGQGDPLVNVLTALTFAIYREPEEATPLWVESQAVLLDAGGRFTALLGATQAEGLPADLFVSGEARWLGVRAQGRPESPRILLVGVPYALKAGDAREDLQLVSRQGASRAVDAAVAGDARLVIDHAAAQPLATTMVSAAAGATAMAQDNVVGGVSVSGSVTSGTSVGDVMFKAAESWTDTSHGTYLSVTTTPSGAVAGVERLRIDSRGYVGVGTTTPGAMLHVAGDAVVDGNVAAKYQDVAEWVASAEPLAPGTVVVVDAARINGVRGSRHAYDVAVAGAVSERPGVMLGERGPGKVLVAQSGRVRVKVDATCGAIRAGDLLVTSTTPGYAMRSRPLRVNGANVHRPGTILGKALEPLPSGRGEILVLLTLQ